MTVAPKMSIVVTGLFIMVLDFPGYLVEPLMSFCRQFPTINRFLLRANEGRT